ncbi:ABC transporter, ATP-binding protein [Companilactobacillus paralimentarius DSM 13238 = JCM 10415]|jgi:ABC-type multidrug transport system, ATPase component|uniref:ABC transporter, ATP-binding protein n=1 Tax=Companilactobacillus paralimentarius DSM 13238 = JCM 10415 TaxID=1122151 RepID=A0A0R1PRG3_9LACO|nr:ABC transporter ATP-binding protein [Companilactobacillus paralimentarius]KAE9562658.1 ABC transporter ATP-binding protein [Companilactobacillus paralimentarius]KRL32154.1 ABC transporter, ATP-binding protein [Companilactobacillus paralimentarius DSM 13238 = JCM 10415]MDR4933894.1 ABC transporter ATP-binding protein [Companilactobacillus paralimentarius]QFR70317.1 ATP-binding cassette domain-containing protein [Companilactobacillus paralimentarius]
MTILEIQHINKSFGKKVILKDINLQIESSSIIALVGANGAGKTTLINIILNLIPQTSGQIKFLTNENWKQITGVMMQDNIVLHRITVKEIISLTRSYFDKPLSYEELLNISGLNNHQNNLMTGLSGGQRRRLAFALALAGNPEILFLDEPTVGMDSNARNEFWQEIDRLKKSGKTIFVTSHYLEELENIADRFLILQNSTIAFDGTIKQLRSREGQSLVEFDSELNQIDFENLANVISINLIGHHFQIITNDVNQLITELTPYLKAIDNLQVKQSTLDTLLLNYKENNHE